MHGDRCGHGEVGDAHVVDERDAAFEAEDSGGRVDVDAALALGPCSRHHVDGVLAARLDGAVTYAPPQPTLAVGLLASAGMPSTEPVT